jgi:hypothetical protein
VFTARYGLGIIFFSGYDQCLKVKLFYFKSFLYPFNKQALLSLLCEVSDSLCSIFIDRSKHLRPVLCCLTLQFR